MTIALKGPSSSSQKIFVSRQNDLIAEAHLEEPLEMRLPFTVSTPIFYVNSKPHLGHAYTMILADAVARWEKLKSGRPSRLLTGTDEHGNKVYAAAKAAGKEPKEYCDAVSTNFSDLASASELNPFQFNRTSDLVHEEKVMYLWNRLKSSGALYLGSHQGWYCTSEECFYPESRTKSIICSTTGLERRVTADSGKHLELVSETNYKFKLGDHLDSVRRWLESSAPVSPKSRLNDLNEVFDEGLPDLSVSRSRATNPWGIQVPDDPSQTIYVWLDALANYLEVGTWRAPNVHVLGKDILKFHAVYWPAFLVAAGLPLPEKLLVHGHWTMGQDKMSKSLGNVVDPFVEMRRFGVDAFRYLLLRIGRLDSDSAFDLDEMKKKYNLELANNLGNLLARLSNSKFYPERTEFYRQDIGKDVLECLSSLNERVAGYYNEHRFHVAIEEIINYLQEVNAKVNEVQPWKLAKEGRVSELETLLPSILFETISAVCLLYPIMPSFVERIQTTYGFDKDSGRLSVAAMQRIGIQFPRIDL